MILYQVFIYCMILYDLLYIATCRNYARGGARHGAALNVFLDLICANDVIILRGLTTFHGIND